MTLLKIDEHTAKLEEMDVEGILAFAERVLPRTADLWVQGKPHSINDSARSSYSSRRELRSMKRLCWNRRNRIGFQLLTAGCGWKERLVDQTGIALAGERKAFAA